MVLTLPPVDFQEYADNGFIPVLECELHNVKSRINVVWDEYHENSINGLTRQKRGTGIRIKDSPKTKISSNWKDFLLHS